MVKRKKMDNNNINNSELFICFTSRLSSSSSTMKKQLSSKSILSPNRINSESNNNNKQISLSSSLSRRLRNNGSLKGGQSPMFLTNGNKKRGGGSGFDNNQEPTSPKVTCIGQVRVKSKKKQLQQQQLGLKMRSISSRKTGEVSFRRIENCSSSSNCKQDQILITQDGLNHRNQKWVHLPLTICEALKGFGSDFNCFSSCSMKDKNGGNGNGDDNHHNHGCSSKFTSCGRWLVVGDGGDGGKGREIELIVRGETETENNEEEDEVLEHRKSSYRKRNVMEDIDIDEIERCNEERFGVLKNDDEKRVSICVPPKNALLLMRCRSDPVKMAALANKFWESNSTTTTTTIVDDHDEKDEENDEQHHEEEKLLGEGEIEKHDEKVEVYENVLAETEDGDLGLMEVSEIVDKSPLEAVIDEINHDPDHEIGEIHDPDQDQESESEMMVSHQNSSETGPEENESSCAIEGETLLYQNVEDDDDDDDDDDEHVESLHNLFNEEEENRLSTHSEAEQIHQTENEEKTEEYPSTTSMEKTAETEQISSPTQQQETTTTTTTTTTTNDESSSTTTLTAAAAAAPKRLPDCLLLMMCEPKLSMEVSKETWVCSTDFIKCLPPPSSNSTATKTEQKKKPSKIKKRVSIDSNPGYIIQPARSSCSFPLNAPAPVLSMGKMIEMKFANSTAAAAVGGYEPFVLTRCKSEPMRKSAKIAPPEGCFWKDKKFEPHHRGAAAGVGC